METEIFWKNEEVKDSFRKKGLSSSEDFFTVDDGNAVFVDTRRQHVGRYSKQLNRWTISLDIDGDIYFLKCSRDHAFTSILNEFEAIQALNQMGTETAEVVASFFDYQNKHGFLLLKNLDGYVSLRDLVKAKVPENVISEFSANKKLFLENILSLFFKIRSANYCYPDWYDKHIFFNLETRKIALIDLERFIHISKFPWYYRIKFIRNRKQRKEKKTLFRNLISEFYPEEVVHQTFRNMDAGK